MSFYWWHPCTATCFVIVTIVEIHRLILDVFVCLHKINIFKMFLLLIEFIIWISLRMLKIVCSTMTVLL